MKKILLMAGAVLVLAGCGEKGDFEKTINAKIGQSKTCFSLRNNDVAFPVQLSKPRFDETGTGTGSVILDGLVEQGLMAFVKGWDNNTLGITDEGKQAKIWDAKEGVCIGRRVVDEVKEWTEPGNGNQKVVRVSYTWKLADVPSWVDKKVFSSVKGMNEPEESMINLVKTSNGWKAI
ncbi:MULTISPECIES: membrane lipoprotein lipid attachment site-containing protein [Klebsiella/Raoultella group]|uniref:membrane lipoprotein lipid attachment site-containing protein n=1 Tax=Klebsiella/Raoultella group TaxID=2890311 RepID=UPI001EECAEA3|nr:MULTISPECIES: membrane lipoprotein lipid attachment site-containing protein [Klebsiella]